MSLNTATNVPATRPSKVADESPAALYAVGDSVQVNSNYENRNFRGQTGVIQTAVLKRGSGKNKGKWMYFVKINGLAYENEKDVQLFEDVLSTIVPNESRPTVGKKVSSRKGNNSKKK